MAEVVTDETVDECLALAEAAGRALGGRPRTLQCGAIAALTAAFVHNAAKDDKAQDELLAVEVEAARRFLAAMRKKEPA